MRADERRVRFTALQSQSAESLPIDRSRIGRTAHRGRVVPTRLRRDPGLVQLADLWAAPAVQVSQKRALLPAFRRTLLG